MTRASFQSPRNPSGTQRQRRGSPAVKVLSEYRRMASATVWTHEAPVREHGQSFHLPGRHEGYVRVIPSTRIDLLTGRDMKALPPLQIIRQFHTHLLRSQSVPGMHPHRHRGAGWRKSPTTASGISAWG
jgi:hypothetical protein